MSENRRWPSSGAAKLGGVIFEERCYRAVCSHDGRFDGAFFTAVITTGIYCRPSCPAITPKRENVRFFTTAAAAQDAGFRACKRCRPDAAPGSPEWLRRQDTVARAVRLIADGVVDREGVSGLASRLGYSPRQLHRIVFAELGTGPLTLAKAHRVQHARMLLETTALPVTDVVFAAGFSSVRQFNDCIRLVYAMTPSELRRAGPPRQATRGGIASADGTSGIDVHLSYRPPLDLRALIGFLAARAIPGVESVDGGVYSRVLTLPHGSGVLSLNLDQPTRPQGRSANRGVAYLTCNLSLDDQRDFVAAVARARRLFDLDADPVAVSTVIAADPAMSTLVRSRPGLRVPGSVDAFEIAVRAVVGQQVSVPAARGMVRRITEALGKPLESARGELNRQFPTAEAVAAAAPSSLPLPAKRAQALYRLAAAVCEGVLALDPGADRDRTEATLRGLGGIGPWTAGYIRMRGLGDPDVFLGTDLAIRNQMALHGPSLSPEAWRPWRSYASAHLWANAAASAPPRTSQHRKGTLQR
jgi:AraC family transcriptional regulator of adaptative response / DNA-3-methyladenine glycosylase II